MSEANCSTRAACARRFPTSLKQIIAAKGPPDLNKRRDVPYETGAANEVTSNGLTQSLRALMAFRVRGSTRPKSESGYLLWVL
jgi:hypothetical protein